jgi:uncharacterized protein YodC (DUF2158 family)
MTSDVVAEAFGVDEQTEILTYRGWVTHRSFHSGEAVLSLDLQSREVCWDRVISVCRFEHDGTLMRWKSAKMEALTTSNHRWPVEAKRGRVARADLTACPECGATEGKRGPFPDSNAVRTHRARKHGILTKDAEHGTRAAVFTGTPIFRTTTELATRYDYIITGGGTPACFTQVRTYDDEFVELIGWTITEGHYQSAPDYQSSAVILAQDSAANPAYVERIRMLAVHFKAPRATVSEYAYDGDTRLHWYFGKGIGQVIRDAAPGRQLTPQFLHALTESQAQLLYQTLIDGDGCRRAPRNSRGIRRGGGAHSELWIQKDWGRINGFQMLAAMLGKRTWAHQRGDGCYTVSVHQDNHSVGRTIPVTEEPYSGIIWRPSLRTQTWLARRNGCTYWSGATPAHPSSPNRSSDGISLANN